MATLEITKEAALKAHNEASQKGRELLENLFGKKTFLKDIKDRIKSVDDAVKELGENDIEVKELFKLQKAGITSHIIYYQMAIVMVKALNEEWVPDWTDSNQYKYYAWFRMGSSSGVGFSYGNYDYWSTCSPVGSRLALKSSDLAIYAGKQFLDIYQKFMTI